MCRASGSRSECDADEDLLLLAPGEPVERLALHPIEIEAEALAHFLHAGRLAVADVRGEAHQLTDGHLEGRRQLRHEADAAEDLLAVRARVQPVHGHLALADILA